MKIPVLFLASVTVARALNVFGEGTIDAGFVDANQVFLTPTSRLILRGPGTYTAASWNLQGNLAMSTQGTYTLVATSGTIIFGPTAVMLGAQDTLGNINGHVILRVVAPGGFQNHSLLKGSVTITQELAPPPPPEPPPLVNLSLRSTLVAGQTQTAGFVIGGRASRRVLIRAIGPALTGFGIPNALATPIIDLFRYQQRFASNNGWRNEAGLAAVFTTVGAFPLPATSRDAAMLEYLEPGPYTVQVSGGAGEVLLEVYFVE
jgi:hypothetical protein